MRKELTGKDAKRAYAIYLRKSRKDKDLEEHGGDTLARHEKILTDLAKQQGLEIGEIYREIVSGDSIAARPEMQRLLHDIHSNKWAGVLCFEVERLSRGDARDQATVAEAFKYSESLIITPVKTYDPNDDTDEEYFEFGLFMSRREYKTIRRRMQTGLQLSVLEGNYLGTYPPYGFDLLDRGRRDRTLTPNEKAEIVKMIFHWYAHEKAGICEIARRLTNMGLPSPGKNDYWTADSISKMLHNVAYIGKVTYGARKTMKEYDPETGKLRVVRRRTKEHLTADGKHPAIIDQETWDITQERQGNSVPLKKDNNLKNALAGLLRCSECGFTMVYRSQITKGKRYSNMQHRREFNHCQCVSSPFGEIMDAIIGALEQHIADFQFKVENSDKSEELNHQRMIAEMEKNLEALKAKRKKILRFFEDDIYTEEEFLERKNDINEEITMLSARLDVAKTETPPVIDYAEKVAKFSEVLALLKDPNATPKAKNDFLKEIICRIDYTRKSRKEPFSLDITLR